MPESAFLSGQLLIAMPGMADPNFDHTVTCVCEHNAGGALGLTINRPIDMDVGSVLRHLDLEVQSRPLMGQPVVRGGPVQPERGFVLHESTQSWDATTAIADAIFVTTSRDILAAVATDKGPQRFLIALGYAGWGPGQLEEEMLNNAWLTAPLTAGLLFETPFPQRWQAAARSLGIDPALLSRQAGHA